MDIKLSLTKFYLSLISPQTFFSRLFRDCILFFRFPIDFLLTFRDPLERVLYLQEINNEAHHLGQKLLRDMMSQMSGGMRAYFVGSNFFKIPGMNDDIDFLVEYTTENEKKKWKNFLVKHFGNPILENKRFTKWEVRYNGFPVEILLSHPKSRIFQKIFFSYNTLLTNPEILANYKKLKQNSVGVTLREYNKRQIYFFDYLVKNNLLHRNSVI